MASLTQWIESSRHLAVLTGAGISVPSGISPFRGPSGLYQNAKVEFCLSMHYFLTRPAEFWKFYWSLFDADLLLHAQPNAVHRWLKNLERDREVTIITQNIDGLHHKAGSSAVIEVHGAFNRCICLDCGAEYDTDQVRKEKVPHCPAFNSEGRTCGTVLKPDIVLFGETVRGVQAAIKAVRRADRLLILGSSLGVAPINCVPDYAKQSGIPTLLINDRPALQMEAIDRFAEADFNSFNPDTLIL
ncbi:NAD-dependent deacetylase [Sporolactobacillus sp. CPB3-1]|uniref:protein acetyllysine N-acetyltransferase n=1 Tax=Sporolactobacillus mangiferae TaxID=2940498 RepID=A0ABT0MA64_9BACL|nr:Sir2 family NAD-dependent protein deacetylase [Sporolactobacillus mangiferae]MCL1631747.1 NAD-dependent deacetylase [Sporolactobacillus mangiferae]